MIYYWSNDVSSVRLSNTCTTCIVKGNMCSLYILLHVRLCLVQLLKVRYDEHLKQMSIITKYILS